MESLGIFNYWIYVVIMMMGFYAVIARQNLVKKVIGLGIFQTGIFLFYISLGVRRGGIAPIKDETAAEAIFTNPIPHVLILTAIVVSLATTAVALAIIVNIHRAYGTIESDEILAADEELTDEADTNGGEAVGSGTREEPGL